MVFRIRERESDAEAEWIAEWPFPPRPYFIESRAYELLLREMARYVRGEVPGRSFLISGHRGSGKTSLVRQTVEDLNRDLLDRAVKRASRGVGLPPDKLERLLSLQRPLLVKLHGPSLLGPVSKPKPTPKPEEAKDQAKPAAQGGKADEKDNAAPAAPAAATSAPTAPKAEPDAPPDQTAFALEQITIGLYRALTMEFGRSFANHARELLAGNAGKDAKDYLELAAQFTLDLDNAPRPAVLRSYYERLGRIQAGVLWPHEIAGLLRPGVNDQGAREIVALATAAQAFEVCSGEITDKQIRKEAQSRDESTETKVEAGLKDLANKILGLAAGVLVGFGSTSWLGWSGGAAAGVATGLLSTLTLSWSSKRSRKDERTRDYTFIRWRDRETLERDLPLVIQRVRDAGLAPVFVLDELDKLADPKKSIAELINGLKHLTTDYGFFCFLTDRDYYDYVARKLEQEAFPVEHSFFSHRLFILPQPKDTLAYLGRITKSESAPTAAAPPAATAPAADPLEEVARSTFGLVVLHRSKLNVIDVLRKIAEECDAQGQVRASPGKLRSDPAYRFEAGIQLVIGLMLLTQKLRDRVENESRFMQRAIDALYMISRAWEMEQSTVRLDRGAIVKCLLGRGGRADTDEPIADALKGAASAKPARQRAGAATKRSPARETAAAKAKREAEEKRKAEEKIAKERAEEAAREADENKKNEADLLRSGMSPLDLKLIEDAVAQLAVLLSDEERLKRWVAVELGPDPEQNSFRDISPPGNLLVLADEGKREYRFLVDVYGQNIETQAQVVAAQAAAVQPQGGPPAPPPGPPPPPAADAAGAAARPAAESKPAEQPVASTLPPELSKELELARVYFREFEGALTAAGVGLSDLVRLQIFPPNLDPVELTRASVRVEQARGQPYDALTKDLQLLQSLKGFATDNRKILTALFQIALGVAQSAREPPLRLADAIAAITRYIDLRAIPSPAGGVDSILDGLSVPFALWAIWPPEDLETLESWRELLSKSKQKRSMPVFGESDRRAVWALTAKNVRDHFIEGGSVIAPLLYEHLVGAAAGIVPANVMRRDLRQMTAADWTKLCLAGFPTGTDTQAPLWCFVAGLYALGFGSRLLTKACELPFYFGEDDRLDLCKELARFAREDSGLGYVLVMRDDGASVGDTVDFLPQHLAEKIITPPLALTERELNDYNEALAWLRAQGAIGSVTYEEDE